jgi:hypothetical protein
MISLFFLTDFAPSQSVPYLPDVTNLELALRHSYHAADAMLITPNELPEIATDNLPNVTFTFAPSVHLIPSRFLLQSIWTAKTIGGEVAELTQPSLITPRI